MMRRALWIVLAVVAVGAALSIVTPAAAGGGCHGEATEASASMVELRKACFTATVTHVDPGQEVAFVNRDEVMHNVVGLGLVWGDMKGMGQGQTMRFTFTDAGVYPYACTLHPGMVGAVVVGDDELHAGDARAVSAASASGSGGSGGEPSTEARPTGATDGSWLPEAVLALVLFTALVGGLAVLARRRVTRATQTQTPTVSSV